MEWWPLKHVWLASGRYASYWNTFLFNTSVTLVGTIYKHHANAKGKISKQHVVTRNIGLVGTSSYRMACACMYCVYTGYLRLWNDDQGEFSPRKTKNNHNSSRIMSGARGINLCNVFVHDQQQTCHTMIILIICCWSFIFYVFPIKM